MFPVIFLIRLVIDDSLGGKERRGEIHFPRRILIRDLRGRRRGFGRGASGRLS